MLGEKLVDTTIDVLEHDINISNLSKGIYMLRIDNKETTVVKKIIKN